MKVVICFSGQPSARNTAAKSQPSTASPISSKASPPSPTSSSTTCPPPASPPSSTTSNKNNPGRPSPSKSSTNTSIKFLKPGLSPKPNGLPQQSPGLRPKRYPGIQAPK